MKDLKECLQAAIGGSATPANTIGMGNPGMNSGDIPVGIIGKPRKLKKIKKKSKKQKKTEEE
jgi:hypothetical protein